MGECPDYEVEVRGDGKVTYRGRRFVMIEGEYSWTIPQSDVTALIEVFRQADYFNLKDSYATGWTDLPSYTTQLTLGGLHKKVFDYGGRDCDEESRNPPCMPESITKIEEAIDEITGATSLISGDARTVTLLEKAGFDFHSARAAKAVLYALNERDAKLARMIVEKGAPLAGEWRQPLPGPQPEEFPAIIMVPWTGDLELARQMIAKGALTDEETRKYFVVASAFSGNPDMVRLALEHFPDLRNQALPKPWIVAAVEGDKPTEEGTYFQDEYKKEKYALWIKNFDQIAVLKLLLGAGASVNAADEEGNTALHFVQDEESARFLLDAGANPKAVNKEGRTPLHETHAGVAKALIRAGANIEARDRYGATPLFNKYDADAVRVLLQAGADVTVRDESGHTALFHQGDAQSAEALIHGGVEVNAVDNQGRSALQSAKGTDVALALLRAGAKTPSDPAALDKLLQWATRNKAGELLSALRERSAEAHPAP